MDDAQLLRQFARVVRDAADALGEPGAHDEVETCPDCDLLAADGRALLRDREAWSNAGRDLVGRYAAYLRRVRSHATGRSLLLEDVAVWADEALRNDLRLWEDCQDTREP